MCSICGTRRRASTVPTGEGVKCFARARSCRMTGGAALDARDMRVPPAEEEDMRRRRVPLAYLFFIFFIVLSLFLCVFRIFLFNLYSFFLGKWRIHHALGVMLAAVDAKIIRNHKKLFKSCCYCLISASSLKPAKSIRPHSATHSIHYSCVRSNANNMSRGLEQTFFFKGVGGE